MAEKVDPYAPLTPSMVKGLSDKLYDKRKAAALELERFVKQLATSDDQAKLVSLTAVLRKEFAFSSNPNSRKGGLIGLSAVAIALGQHYQNIASYLHELVPPILSCFLDADQRVRYYACEAFYNVAKVARGDVLTFFTRIFDALSKLAADSDPGVKNGAELLDRLIKDIVTESPTFDIQSFISLLTERIFVVNPFTRQFIVSWLSVLNSVPEIDLLGYLPNFLNGLFKILSDPNAEIRRMCEAVLGEFLREIKSAQDKVDFAALANILLDYCTPESDHLAKFTAMAWLSEFMLLAKLRMLPFTSQLLEPILSSLAMEVEANIREAATAANSRLMKLISELPVPCLETGPEAFVLSTTLPVLTLQLQKDALPTRLAALRWLLMLHRTMPLKFYELVNGILPSLLRALSDNHERVALLDLELFAQLSLLPDNSGETQPGLKATEFFSRLMVELVGLFRDERELLERHGPFIIRHLCTLLTAEKIFNALAGILLAETNLEFASLMVQNLNIILLTTPELVGLRAALQELRPEIRPLFCVLYRTWSHSPIATLALCLLCQVYDHACEVLHFIGRLEVTVALLLEIDKLVQLLESPIFTRLRLQLLEPQRHAYLIKCLYGLLMLLPQSGAHETLRHRLECIPTIIHSLVLLERPEEAKTQKGNIGLDIPFAELMAHLQTVQARHTDAVRAAARSRAGYEFVL